MLCVLHVASGAEPSSPQTAAAPPLERRGHTAPGVSPAAISPSCLCTGCSHGMWRRGVTAENQARVPACWLAAMGAKATVCSLPSFRGAQEPLPTGP